jgi:predicted nucleic acid-binding protein
MIAIDTSAFARFLAGVEGEDTLAVDLALESKSAVLPPVVLSELLSNPRLTGSVRELIVHLPLLELPEGYWERSGLARAELLRKGYKALMADCLVAQSCIDNDVALITHDRDYRHFVARGLRLVFSGP